MDAGLTEAGLSDANSRTHVRLNIMRTVLQGTSASTNNREQASTTNIRRWCVVSSLSGCVAFIRGTRWRECTQLHRRCILHAHATLQPA